MANYPNIDTELLRSFVAIADHGGFTRAAAAVNRTQSAVSMQMKRLEEDVLQRPLFERNGRQVRFTAEGQILLGYARRILKLHGEVMTTLRQPHMVGAVRIGTPDDYVMRFLPGILSRFAQQLNAFSLTLSVKSIVAFAAMLVYIFSILSQDVPRIWHSMHMEQWLLPGGAP